MKAHAVRAKIGIAFIVAGILLILSAGGYCGYNMWQEYQAGVAAEAVLELMPDVEPDPGVPDYLMNPDMEMPTIEVDGRRYIGVLEFPSLALKLPVLSEWSYDGLKIAPCRYTGSVYKNDIVIAGHNYRRHFTRIKTMEEGSTVLFKDVTGNEFKYSVTDGEVIKPMDVDGMVLDDSGTWDMTLFTCTSGGSARYALRCELVAATGQYL